MCLAIPARVKTLHGDGMATVETDGVEQRISVELLEDVNPGDYVIMHVGYALNRLDPAEAEETLNLFEEVGILERAPAGPRRP